MPFVLDASVAASWCFRNETTPYNQSILDTLINSYAEVPALWLIEIANVLAINERKGRITPAISGVFLQTLAGLDIRVEPGDRSIGGEVLLTLTRRYGLTAYDAAYLELAKRRNLPLATFDKDLLRAAPLEGVALVPQP